MERKNSHHSFDRTAVRELTVKSSILVLCTGNSCRSHMAEGILRAALSPRFDVFSAGSKPAGHVHPLAITVMDEIGIDLTSHRSKSMAEFFDCRITTVITVCDRAGEACPRFPGQLHRYHWSFEDPAHATGSDDEILASFRRVRDQIKSVFEAYAAGLIEGSTLP